LAKKKSVKEEISFGRVLRALLILALLYIILTPILATSQWYTDVPEGREDLKSKDLAEAIFETYTVPFVIISLTLVTSILGGIYLAKEEEEPRPGKTRRR
jgi:NADH:ubiquinone oxidoreductase subunit 6 (subunit J)